MQLNCQHNIFPHGLLLTLATPPASVTQAVHLSGQKSKVITTSGPYHVLLQRPKTHDLDAIAAPPPLSARLDPQHLVAPGNGSTFFPSSDAMSVCAVLWTSRVQMATNAPFFSCLCFELCGLPRSGYFPPHLGPLLPTRTAFAAYPTSPTVSVLPGNPLPFLYNSFVSRLHFMSSL